MEKTLLFQNIHDEEVAIGEFIKFSLNILYELKHNADHERGNNMSDLSDVEYWLWKGYYEILSPSLWLIPTRNIALENILEMLWALMLQWYFDENLNYYSVTHNLHRELSRFHVEVDDETKVKLREKWAEVYEMHHKHMLPDLPQLQSPIKYLINDILSDTSVDMYIPEVLLILKNRSFLESQKDVKFIYNFLEYLVSKKLLLQEDFRAISRWNSPIESAMHNFFTKYFLSRWEHTISTIYRWEIEKYAKDFAWIASEKEDASSMDAINDIPAEYQIVSIVSPYITTLSKGSKISYSSNLTELLDLLEEQDFIRSETIYGWETLLSLPDTSYQTQEVIIDILYHLFIGRFFEDFDSLLPEVWSLLMTHYQFMDCDGELNSHDIPVIIDCNESVRLWTIEKYLWEITDTITQDDIIDIWRRYTLHTISDALFHTIIQAFEFDISEIFNKKELISLLKNAWIISRKEESYFKIIDSHIEFVRYLEIILNYNETFLNTLSFEQLEELKKCFYSLDMFSGELVQHQILESNETRKMIISMGENMINTLLRWDQNSVTHDFLNSFLELIQEYFPYKPFYMRVVHIEFDELTEIKSPFHKALQILWILVSDILNADDSLFEDASEIFLVHVRDVKTHAAVRNICSEKTKKLKNNSTSP